jgi:glyoxylase-like metal-dependent hydrolase (beta-lactamase superfamily II)
MLLSTLLQPGCATSSRRVPEGAELILKDGGDPQVGTFVSSAWGFETSSYFIEGPEGLVLVDTQFHPSTARRFVEWAEATTGKRAVLAVVLHANPDKFNGTRVLQERGIRVVTSEAVRALIPDVHRRRFAAFWESNKPDYPQAAAAPDGLGKPTPGGIGNLGTHEIRAAGLVLKAHLLGPGCGAAHLALQHRGHLFVGDLVASGVHAWLEIGRTDQWLERLAELGRLSPKRVHPGRGPSGDAGLLARQAEYLRRVIALVAAEKPSGEPDKNALSRVQAKLDARYPGYGYGIFLRFGLPAEWRRQAGSKK